LTNEAGCPDGTPLYWTTSCVGFSFQRNFSRWYEQGALREAIEKSFQAWANVPCPGGGVASITFVPDEDVSCKQQEFNQDGPNANIIIFRDTDFRYTDVDNTLAKTTVTYDTATGEIKDADIEINTTYNEFSLDDDPGTLYDLQAVMTHEVGHFIGINHTQTSHPEATMFSRYAPGDTKQRDLSPDDVEAVCAAYPPGRPDAVCDPTPRNGFAESCVDETSKSCSLPPAPGRAPAGAALVVAALAIVIRRVRRAQPRPTEAC
jgi:hypothetical protein